MATSGDYLGGAMTAREFYDAAISSLRSCLKEENIIKQGEVPRAVTEFAGALREDGFDDKDERKPRLAALEDRLVAMVNGDLQGISGGSMAELTRLIDDIAVALQAE
jgi:hypothetical protein